MTEAGFEAGPAPAPQSASGAASGAGAGAQAAGAALPADLAGWLAASAEGIDRGDIPAAAVLPRLAAAGLTRLAVPAALGGDGAGPAEAVQAVAAVAQHSLAAAFMLWGHRCYAEFLVRTPNAGLRAAQLPAILAGERAGASALSNVMKHLAGLEPLQVTARSEGGDIVINGKLPWVTNLRKDGFWVAAAADPVGGGPAIIVSLAHDDPGLVRSDDLALMGMRSSDTAAVTLTEVRIPAGRIIAQNAQDWLPGVRPLFIALQCGMTIGLSRRALAEARKCSGAGRAVLGSSIEETAQRIDRAEAQVLAGIGSGSFAADTAPLFRLRIELAELAQEAVSLELQAGGGRNFLEGSGRDFARRWREAAFVPLITPSLVQLRSVLAAASRAA